MKWFWMIKMILMMIFQDLPIDPRTAASEMTVDKLLSYTPSADQVFFQLCDPALLMYMIVHQVKEVFNTTAAYAFQDIPEQQQQLPRFLKDIWSQSHHNPHPGTARPTWGCPARPLLHLPRKISTSLLHLTNLPTVLLIRMIIRKRTLLCIINTPFCVKR